MLRTLEQIIAAFLALKSEDFDLTRRDASGIEQLYALTDDLMHLPQPERGIRAMFEVMERMPESDLGSPGPLVHTLEKMPGHYEIELVESLKRTPTPLAVWMVNRLLNAALNPDQRQFYMDLLRSIVARPEAPEVARLEAQNFIKYQSDAT